MRSFDRRVLLLNSGVKCEQDVIGQSVLHTAERLNEFVPIPIYVDAYSGCKANEHPRQFVLDEQVYEITAARGFYRCESTMKDSTEYGNKQTIYCVHNKKH